MPLRSLRQRSLHWCAISPDADWIACSTIGSPGIWVLLRADGSEPWRLSDFSNTANIAAWSPDEAHATVVVDGRKRAELDVKQVTTRQTAELTDLPQSMQGFFMAPGRLRGSSSAAQRSTVSAAR